MRKLIPILLITISAPIFSQNTTPSVATDVPKSGLPGDDINTLMRLEHERKIKKIKDEINKVDSPSLPSVVPPPVVEVPKAKKVAEPPAMTTAIFGVAPNYRGDLLVHGARYSQVRIGTKVAEFTVVNITTDGIELERQDPFVIKKAKPTRKPISTKKINSVATRKVPKYVTTLVYAPLIRDGN